MKRNKAFIHFLLIIVLLAALAGCVKRDASVPSPGVTPGPEDTAPDAPTATPEPTSAPLEYGRIAEFDPPGIKLDRADTNRDGVINVRDVTEIQRYLAGIITQF